MKGILCTALDISRIRSTESEQRQLNEELATAVQRYEFGLRGSNVTVFTQDTDLRYTAVSKPMFGRAAAELREQDGRRVAVRLACGCDFRFETRGAGERGIPLNAESRVDSGKKLLWYDLHIEPMRDVSGMLTGLTGGCGRYHRAQEAEAHLRLLMRELTHRSKNLLAVIQAMARQTARHSGQHRHVSGKVQRPCPGPGALARSSRGRGLARRLR